jgi:hypothetical protein
MNTETRDRAFDRAVVIALKDKDRMLSILDTIPRPDLVKSHTHENGRAYFVLKIKKQELLMIKLAIETKSVSKLKKRKKTYRQSIF